MNLHLHDPAPPPLPAVRNNIYVRCANGSRYDGSGQVFVAMGAVSLPCWPDLLQPLSAPEGTPLATSAAGTNPRQAALRTVHALKDFFAGNAGYAQRSVAYGIADRYTFQARYQQREAAAEMHLELRAHDCDPAWKISVLTQNPDTPLQIAPFVLGQRSAWVSVAGLVPAGYDDTLTLCIDTQGQPPGAGARVDLVLSVRLAVPVPTCPDSAGEAQPTLFRLGCHSWRAQSPTTERLSQR